MLPKLFMGITVPLSIAQFRSPWLQPVRYIWRAVRRIPFMRRAIEQLILYPRLSHIKRAASYADGPLLIAGFFTSAHGIGEAARLELAAQRAIDARVLGVDIAPAFGLCEMSVPEGVVPLGQASALGPLLLHCNAPEAGRALQYLGKELTENRYVIGYWAWELEVPPRDWERAYPYLDELWVPSTFTAKAFAAAPIAVKVHPHPIVSVPDGGHSLTDLGLPECEGRTVFLCMADARSDLVRKNIRGTARVFGKALGNTSQAVLVVKLHHTESAGPELKLLLEECATWSNIYVLDTLLSKEERNSLLHRCNVVLSLHRSEGYGLLCAEGVSLGKSVIATAYGGILDFLHTENSSLVPFRLVPVRSDDSDYGRYSESCWAEVDMAIAIKTLRIYN